MIDSHCHLDFTDFDHDRDSVVQQCQNNGVSDIIVPAVSADTFERTIQVCSAYQPLHLALGLHPMFIDQHQPQDLLELDAQIKKHKPIAVGEIGLDFYDKSSKDSQEKQIAFFTKQLIIAKQHNLPVIIHNRKAHDQCLGLLAEHQVSGGIIHAFNGSVQQAYKYIEMGFLLGFGGMLTFERSAKLRKLAEHIPLEFIALETDAPDMVVEQHKGQRNSPEYLPLICAALADVKRTTVEDIDDVTCENVKQLFGI